jgi:glycosyltransferase involved in cell wall biosynthesis
MLNNPIHPLISVVIPAFQEEKYLPRALQSVLGQEYKNFELIVVNNNSSDKTAEIAEKFGAKVIFELRQGVGFARQAGFLAAKGDIIATTDADAVLPKNWLSRIAKEFEEDNTLAAFGGLYTLYSGPITARFAISYFFYFIWLLDKIFSGGGNLPGANSAFRKSAFLRIGGFNTKLSMCEDVDLSQRIKNVGKVLLDPDFRIQVSGRRFRQGLLFGLLVYAPNHIARILFKKNKFMKLPTVRKESSLIGKLFFMPLFFLVIFLSSLFFFSNPLIKSVKLAQKPIAYLDRQFKAQEQSIKYFISGAKDFSKKYKNE